MEARPCVDPICSTKSHEKELPRLVELASLQTAEVRHSCHAACIPLAGFVSGYSGVVNLLPLVFLHIAIQTTVTPPIHPVRIQQIEFDDVITKDLHSVYGSTFSVSHPLGRIG